MGQSSYRLWNIHGDFLHILDAWTPENGDVPASASWGFQASTRWDDRMTSQPRSERYEESEASKHRSLNNQKKTCSFIAPCKNSFQLSEWKMPSLAYVCLKQPSLF